MLFDLPSLFVDGKLVGGSKIPEGCQISASEAILGSQPKPNLGVTHRKAEHAHLPSSMFPMIGLIIK